MLCLCLCSACALRVRAPTKTQTAAQCSAAQRARVPVFQSMPQFHAFLSTNLIPSILVIMLIDYCTAALLDALKITWLVAIKIICVFDQSLTARNFAQQIHERNLLQ
jgi:hypothetical protein